MKKPVIAALSSLIALSSVITSSSPANALSDSFRNEIMYDLGMDKVSCSYNNTGTLIFWDQSIRCFRAQGKWKPITYRINKDLEIKSIAGNLDGSNNNGSNGDNNSQQSPPPAKSKFPTVEEMPPGHLAAIRANYLRPENCVPGSGQIIDGNLVLIACFTPSAQYPPGTYTIVTGGRIIKFGGAVTTPPYHQQQPPVFYPQPRYPVQPPVNNGGIYQQSNSVIDATTRSSANIPANFYRFVVKKSEALV